MRLYCTLGPPLEKVIFSAAVLPSHSTRHLAVDGQTGDELPSSLPTMHELDFETLQHLAKLRDALGPRSWGRAD
jgi:hypothetical protein